MRFYVPQITYSEKTMVYLVIAVILITLSVKGYCAKRTSIYIEDTGDAFLFNLVRMIFCLFIGTVLVFAEGTQGQLLIDGGMLAVCAISGITNAALLVGWILAVRKNTMVMLDVGTTLGSIIPALLCAFLFGEAISLPKMAGFALIVIATMILASYGKDNRKSTLSGILLLLFTLVSDGMTSFAQQLYKQYYTKSGIFSGDTLYPKSVFHFYTYVFAVLSLAIVLVAYRLVTRKKNKEEGVKPKGLFTLPLSLTLHILVMAVCMFAANYFQTVAATDLSVPSQVLYPVIKGGSLVMVNFTAMIFFGERITVRSVCGSIVAIAGMICMNIF